MGIEIGEKKYIYGTTSNKYIDSRFEVYIPTYSMENNDAHIYIRLQYKSNKEGFTASGRIFYKIILNGKTVVNSTKIINITEDAWVTASEYTKFSSKYNEDGTHDALKLSGEGDLSGIFAATVLDGTVTPDTRDRPTIIDSLTCDTTYFNGTITYKYTPKYAEFYNLCNIHVVLDKDYELVKTIYLGKKAASQQTDTISFSADELATIYNSLPNASKGTLRFSFQTHRNSNYNNLAGYSEKVINLSIPNTTDTKPTMTMSLSPVTDLTPNSLIYLKSISKVKATFTDGAGKYGASIASYKLTVSGKEYASPDTSESIIESDYLATTGSITVNGIITDSRGFSNTYTETITVLDYNNPAIDSLICNTTYFDGTLTYKYTPASAAFYSRCVVELKINDTYTQIRDIELGVKSVSQQTDTVDLVESELSTIYNKFPRSTVGTLRFTLKTYIDADYSEQIGQTDYKEITLSIPNIDATKPTATLTISPVTSLGSPFNTIYVKGKTKVTANLTSGAGKYGASVTSYSVSIGSQVGTPPQTSQYLTLPGDVIIRGTVTDSRGFSRTYTETITVIDYGKPRILPVSSQSSVIVARCNSEGALDDNGAFLLIAARRSYSEVISEGVQKNFCAIQYRYKESTGSYSSWITILDRTAATNEIVTEPLPGFEITKSYFVQIRAIDDIGESVISVTTISTEKVYMHRAGSKNSLGLGKLVEKDNTFDVAEDITSIFRGKLNFQGEKWTALELYSSVLDSETAVGRYGGSGAYYRVCAGEKRIIVIFNVKFTTSSSTVRVVDRYKTGTTEFQIPAAYRPAYDVYTICPVGFTDGSRGIATVSVDPSGIVNIYAVHNLPGATLSTGDEVEWIDGYIDFWT
jgi:hypothetical protein